ncbi:MAG: hypothetical protein K1X92_00080 [Bacteroidia bacterium]|nr:hypothetical protein [Bacteroidia bacterium]
MKHELDNFPLLKSLKNIPLPEVPEGYFEHFEANLIADLKLKELKPLMSTEEPPAHYFELLTESILSVTGVPLPEESEYEDIPYGYFEELPERIVETATQQDELPAIFDRIPVQKETKDENAYFESFESRLMSKIQSTETAKSQPAPVFSLWGSNVRKFAVGIAATVLLGFGISRIYQNHTGNVSDAIVSFSSISDQELMEYLSEDEALDIEILKEELPLSEIKSKPTGNADFKEVSDDELLEYLNDDSFGEI